MRLLMASLASLFLALSVQSGSDLVPTPTPPVESFQLEDLGGTLHDLKDPPGIHLIIFWNPQMSNTVRALGIASRIAGRYPGLEVWTIVPGEVPREEIQRSRERFSAGRFKVLLDPGRQVLAGLGVIAMPTFMVVDADLRLRFKMANITPDLEVQLGLQLDELMGRPPSQGKVARSSLAEAREPLPAAAKRGLTLATLLASKRLPEEAAGILRELAEKYPDQHAVQIGILYRALELELWEEAGRALERCKSLRPEGREFLAGEVYLLLRTGRSQQALDLQEELLPQDEHREWLLKRIE